LPEDFEVASMINKIAISRDGRYAVVVGNDLMISTIPESGRIEVDGMVINYRRGAGGSRINVSGRGNNINLGGSVSISGGSVNIGGSDLGYEISEDYSDVSSVSVREVSNSVLLEIGQEDKIHVEGLTNEKPTYDEKRLIIDGLHGKLVLPRTGRIEQSIETVSGDVEGRVANPGRIKTVSGDISLILVAPITVLTGTISGDVDVYGMVAGGRRRYTPKSGESYGTLNLETISGDIHVRYENPTIKI
jgi:hypothetical protein